MQNKFSINDIPDLIIKISSEIALLNKFIFKNKNNLDIYIKTLSNNLEFLEWINRSTEIRSKEAPQVVKQREIFYCELGVNIGSEQGLKRPVVILQNDFGNSKGDTTIIAPITTYEHKDIIEREGKTYIKNMVDGVEKLKLIDFYEVPVRLETGYTQEIIGFINIVHMREVSKRRLSKVPVAKITIGNFGELQTSIIRNLNFVVDKKE